MTFRMKRSKKIRDVINCYDCPLCDKWFVTKHTMKRHMSLHLGTEQFHCDICEKDFASDYNLKRHKASVHEELETFDCTRCNKYFIRRSNYEHHMETHIEPNDFPYECNICLQAFSENKTLLSHIATHSETKPSFHCNICSKVFIHRAGLNRHKLIHTSKKPYKCFMCNLEFPDVASRSRHVMHHGVFCGLCRISLKDVKDFKSHIIDVHKPKQRFSKNMENAKKSVATSKPGDNTCVTENSHGHMFNEDEVVEGIDESSNLKSSNNVLNTSSNDEFSNANSKKIQNQLAQQSNMHIQHETNVKINYIFESNWNRQSNFMNSYTNLISQNSVVANTTLDANDEFYVNWLSEFLHLCKSVKKPFSIQLTQKLYEAYLVVLKLCKNPVGIIKKKKTFATLVYIHDELQKFVHQHWEYVCDEFFE